MDDFASKLGRLRDAVDPRWTAARARRVEASMASRGRRQARARRVLISFATVCLLSVVGGLGWAGLRRYVLREAPGEAPTVRLPPAPTAAVTPALAASSGPTAKEAPVVTETPTAAAGPPTAPSAVSPETSTGAVPASASWRRWAHEGDYESAFKSLETAGSAAVKDEPADLLLASDVARLSGHPTEAVDPLKRILRDHPSDPRAPLAAFTLGRVLLDELGRPADAAAAFSRALALAPGGPLEEDALAREVEAFSRAGDPDRAHEVAETYVSRFPAGRRLRSVQRFGGLD